MKRDSQTLMNVTFLGLCFHLEMKMLPRIDGLFRSQKSFTIIDAIGLSARMPSRNPLHLAHPLYRAQVSTTEMEKLKMRYVLYWKILESILSLCTKARLDLATASALLGSFQSGPHARHRKAMKLFVWYLRKITDYYSIFPRPI